MEGVSLRIRTPGKQQSLRPNVDWKVGLHFEGVGHAAIVVKTDADESLNPLRHLVWFRQQGLLAGELALMSHVADELLILLAEPVQASHTVHARTVHDRMTAERHDTEDFLREFKV